MCFSKKICALIEIQNWCWDLDLTFLLQKKFFSPNFFCWNFLFVFGGQLVEFEASQFEVKKKKLKQFETNFLFHRFFCGKGWILNVVLLNISIFKTKNYRTFVLIISQCKTTSASMRSSQLNPTETTELRVEIASQISLAKHPLKTISWQ